MNNEVLMRRAVHCLMALAPVYYLFPVDLPVIGVRRWVLLIAFFAVVGLIEAIRLPKGILIFGMRPYEKEKIAAFVWAAAGITAALWLFPHDIASAVIVGMALVDPLAGELRSRKVGTSMCVGVSSLVYLAICGTTLLIANHHSLPVVMMLALVGTAVAIVSEHFKNAYVDDDFLMACAPGVVMTALALVL